MRLQKGSIVKHFKYETLSDEAKEAGVYTYEILETDAMHTETKESLVVYKALYDGDAFGLHVKKGQAFVRPSEMFFSEVDHEKYPEIKQKYRFEKLSENVTQRTPEGSLYHMEWTGINDQKSFEGFVRKVQAPGYSITYYEQAARLFYTNGHKTVMVELQIPTDALFKNNLCNQCTPWLDAYLVYDMQDYDTTAEVASTYGRDEDISFKNAEAKMLEIAMHVLDENQD